MPQGINFEVEMKVTQNGRPTKYVLENDLAGQQTFEQFVQFMKQGLISISLDVLKEEQRQGFDKNPVTLVDRRIGKSILDVSPFGTIEFKKRVQSLEIIRFTYKQVIRRSPIDTGLYSESHFVFLNGKRIATNELELEAWIRSGPKIQANDFLRIVNVVPYARRLERLGVTKQRTRRVRIRTDRRRRRGTHKSPTNFSLRPNGVYFLSTRAAKRKYKGNVSIYFGFIPGAQLGISTTFKTKRRPREKPRTYLYPTIKIYIGGKRGVSD